MPDTESVHPDLGLEYENIQSESLTKANDAFDKAPLDLISLDDQEIIGSLLESADNQYDENPEEWDAFLRDLKKLIDSLRSESNTPKSYQADSEEEEEEEELASGALDFSKKLSALQKRANSIEA